ncbi:10265_t:CDS:1, partial [Dentiscutata erythropus]
LYIGNILSYDHDWCFITDLGLSKPADETEISKDSKQKVFRIIPYIALEYYLVMIITQRHQIMIMFEILTGIPPFYNIPHDKDLVFKICNGYRPEIPSNSVIPQLLVDIMKRCWNAKSERRPVDNSNTNSLAYEINSSAIYTSRGFNFKNLPKPKNLNENDDKIQMN